MGAYTCEFGVVHKVCRCPTPHKIKCDKPKEHGTPTETGKWIKKQADVHVCKKPTYQESPGVKIYDQWECGGCHAVWEVSGFDSGMQWDPFPTVIRWKRIVERDA